MPTYTLLPGMTSEVATDVGGATFTNLGTSTVSYSDSQDALAAADGTLAAGATVTLFGTVFLGVPATGARTDVQVVLLAATSGLRTVNAYSPTGAVAENFSRAQGTPTDLPAILTSGRLQMIGIELIAGRVINSITFHSGTTAASVPTNQWFSLWTAARVRLAVTANDGATAWAANTAKTLALTAAVTVPSTGLYYVGVVVTATTPPTLFGGNSGAPFAISPIVAGTADTGLTTPATAPATAAALTAAGAYPWVYVS